MDFILDQLARTGLLPESESKAILAGKAPSFLDLASHFLILSLDADAVTASDKTATWVQRRLSRQLLGVTFLTALLLDRIVPPDHQSTSGAVALEKTT
jgi:hypothetical protein